MLLAALVLVLPPASALIAPVQLHRRAPSIVTPSRRFSEVMDRVDDGATVTIEAAEASSNGTEAVEGAEAAVGEAPALLEIKDDIYTPLFGKRARAAEAALTAPVSDVDEFLIKWGFKEDPRIPFDERVDQMTRIKNSGKAGIVAYALTEGAFWLGSIPFAYAAIKLATGSFPDFATTEGKEAIGADIFVFINFARLIVPARIALALGLAPWVDENILQKFGKADDAQDDGRGGRQPLASTFLQ